VQKTDGFAFSNFLLLKFLKKPKNTEQRGATTHEKYQVSKITITQKRKRNSPGTEIFFNFSAASSSTSDRSMSLY
jgi:hypothetical protein